MDSISTPCTPRHRFHRSHLTTFVLCIGTCILAALLLLLTRVDAGVRNAGMPMLVAMAGYFALVHAAPRAWQKYWPKELAMAILFALGTCLPVYAESPKDGPAMLPPLALFAALCWINAVAIDRWERDEAVAWLVPVALLASGLALSLSLSGNHPWLYRAAGLAAASLAWLARHTDTRQERIAAEKRRGIGRRSIGRSRPIGAAGLAAVKRTSNWYDMGEVFHSRD